MKRVTKPIVGAVNNTRKLSPNGSGQGIELANINSNVAPNADPNADPSLRAWSIEALTARDAVGDGTQPTLDPNVVEDLAMAAGIKNLEGHPLRTLRILKSRDDHRWELEPESSEDYPEHGGA